MSKTTAPLLSFDGSGQIAKTMVYSSWKGVPYVRRYVIPANPQSPAQTETRTVFRFLSQAFANLPTIGREPWVAAAKGRPLTDRNAMMGVNTKRLRSPTVATDLSLFLGSNGANGGPPPSGISDTPAATTMTIDVAVPSPPTGWSLTGAQGIIMLDQDPQLDFEGFVQAQEDTSSTYSLVFTGLTTATDYMVSVWLKWLKPGGGIAYSVALTDIVTTS